MWSKHLSKLIEMIHETVNCQISRILQTHHSIIWKLKVEISCLCTIKNTEKNSNSTTIYFYLFYFIARYEIHPNWKQPIDSYIITFVRIHVWTNVTIPLQTKQQKQNRLYRLWIDCWPSVTFKTLPSIDEQRCLCNTIRDRSSLIHYNWDICFYHLWDNGQIGKTNKLFGKQVKNWKFALLLTKITWDTILL